MLVVDFILVAANIVIITLLAINLFRGRKEDKK